MRLWTEYRVLSAIVLFAIVAGAWEVTQVGSEGAEGDSSERVAQLAEAYPSTPRVLHGVGLDALLAGDPERALPFLREAYQAGYREKEVAFSAYIDVLVLTASDPATIAEVVASWQNDYPHSEKLAERVVRACR